MCSSDIPGFIAIRILFGEAFKSIYYSFTCLLEMLLTIKTSIGLDIMASYLYSCMNATIMPHKPLPAGLHDDLSGLKSIHIPFFSLY